MGKAKAPPFKASATPSLALLLNPLAWLLWILDFLLWFALFGWVKTVKQLMKGPYSVECGGTAVREPEDSRSPTWIVTPFTRPSKSATIPSLSTSR